MSTTASPELDSLEQARRLSGLKFTSLSELTGIPYKRLWRFFKDDGPLNRHETLRLQAVLTEVPPVTDAEGHRGD